MPALQICWKRECIKTTESVHDNAFKELIKFKDPLLEEELALELPSLLVKFKTCLKDVDVEQSESYTTQKLKVQEPSFKALWI